MKHTSPCRCVPLLLLVALVLVSMVTAREEEVMWKTRDIGETLEASPAVDDKSNVYIQTSKGTFSYNPHGKQRWKNTDATAGDAKEVFLLLIGGRG